MTQYFDLEEGLVLWRCQGVGPLTFYRIIQAYPALSHFFTQPQIVWQRYGLKKKAIEQLLEWVSGVPSGELRLGVNTDLAWLKKDSRHHIISINDSRYPSLLKQIKDPPPFLFLCGNPELLGCLLLAVVGSRQASLYGAKNAFNFSKYLSQRSICIVSGLAKGIDKEAHLGALEGSGKTIGVVAHGLDAVYPAENKFLFERLKQEGLIVSEFPIGVRARPDYFPRRNRIISGLSMGVLVIEGSLRSGSLITAKQAMEQGRDVFAIPGSIHELTVKGCHQLIKEGAALVESAEDVLILLPAHYDIKNNAQQCNPSSLFTSEKQKHSETLKVESGPAVFSIHVSKEERHIIELIQNGASNIDELCATTTWSVQQVTMLLTAMEIKDLISWDVKGYTVNASQS